MNPKVHFADKFQPDFGMPWAALPPREVVESWPVERIREYAAARQKGMMLAEQNPIACGWTLPMWSEVMANWGKYRTHVILGGNRSSKSTIASRLAVWAAGTIPQGEVRTYQANKEKSIDEQQRYVWEAIPLSIKNMQAKKGQSHSIQYSQKNGFTDNVCIFPPHPGYQRGGYIRFANYAQYADDPNTAESFKAHLVWCIAAGQQVQMADGTLKAIEKIKVGDEVLSLDAWGQGVAKKVTATQFNGEKQCVRIKGRNGSSVICTPEHEIFWGYGYESKHEASDAKRIAQIRPGWWPENTNDRDDAWYIWAALIVAEGDVRNRKVTNGNDAAMQKAVDAIPPTARVRKYVFKPEQKHVPDYYLFWDEMWREWDCVTLSETKEIPSFVFTSSKEKARLFLRWLYHGDGWANGHSISYATTSEILANQLIVLLSRLGIKACMTVRKSKVKNWKDQYWVVISKAEAVLKFIEEIGIEQKEEAVEKVKKIAQARVLALSRRGRNFLKTGNGAKWKARNDNDKLRTTNLVLRENVGARPVYDITVEDTHRFLVGTCLVSNCDEECPPALFETLLYRTIDYHGRLLLTFTTINGYSPLVQKILGNTRTLKSAYAPLVGRKLPIIQESISNPDTIIYYFWTEHNAFLGDDSFVQTLKGRPRDEILARAYGVPTKSVSGVFTAFNKDVNVIKHEELPWIKKPDYPVTRYMAIDPAGSKNWFMVWVAIDAAGTWWVYREWPDYDDWALPGPTVQGKSGPAQKGSKRGIRDYVELIKSMEEGEEIYERYIDPRLGAAEKQSEDGATTIISDLDRCELPVIPAPGVEIENGIQLLQNLLAWDEAKPRDSMNTPKLFISENCRNVIYAMGEYTAKGGKDEASKDPIDVLRYIAVSNPEFYEKKDFDPQGTTFSY